MVPRRRGMNGAEDDEDAARGDAGGIYRGDGRRGGDDDEGSASPEALDTRVLRRDGNDRDEGERIDEEAHDEEARRTGGEERRGEERHRKEIHEEVDGHAPQADHETPLAAVSHGA